MVDGVWVDERRSRWCVVGGWCVGGRGRWEEKQMVCETVCGWCVVGKTNRM